MVPFFADAACPARLQSATIVNTLCQILPTLPTRDAHCQGRKNRKCRRLKTIVDGLVERLNFTSPRMTLCQPWVHLVASSSAMESCIFRQFSFSPLSLAPPDYAQACDVVLLHLRLPLLIVLWCHFRTLLEEHRTSFPSASSRARRMMLLGQLTINGSIC